ncbi:hypothetical protein CW309_01480 [Pseudomonas hunanensis]|nr:hypothetical protein CW309_01480 [Pseudomonas hunanensis]
MKRPNAIRLWEPALQRGAIRSVALPIHRGGDVGGLESVRPCLALAPFPVGAGLPANPVGAGLPANTGEAGAISFFAHKDKTPTCMRR